MARFIDADKVLQELGDAPLNWTDSDAEIQEQYDYKLFKSIVESQPTADVVEVKHGHWIKNIRRFSVMSIDGYVRDEEKVTHTCSVCRIGIVGLDNMDYCPHCGAKMDAEGGAE